MTSETVGIDSKLLLFAKLQEYRIEIPNFIPLRRYNNGIKIKNVVIAINGFMFYQLFIR